jgi:hypothetical protein
MPQLYFTFKLLRYDGGAEGNYKGNKDYVSTDMKQKRTRKPKIGL